MDNKNNLAYDYQRFEEKKQTQIKEVSKAAKPKRQWSVAKAVCYMMVAVVMASMLIYSKVVQTELSNEYETTNNQIAQVKNENSRLEIQLESKLSLENIENIAEDNLGLSKLRNEQIKYVEFDEQDKAVVVQRHSFWKDIAGWFTNLLA